MNCGDIKISHGHDELFVFNDLVYLEARRRNVVIWIKLCVVWQSWSNCLDWSYLFMARNKIPLLMRPNPAAAAAPATTGLPGSLHCNLEFCSVTILAAAATVLLSDRNKGCCCYWRGIVAL